MSIFEYDKEEEEKKLRKAEFEAGVEEGEMRKAKETALMLQEMGLSTEKIAHAVNLGEEIVRKWIEK